MDNITNLVQEAYTTIDEFEKYMYTNHLEKYITIKEFAAAMVAKVAYVESMTRINAIQEDNMNDVEAKLNFVINKVAEIKTSFANGHNMELIVDDNGDYRAQEIGKKESLTSFKDYQPIESSAVKITNYNPAEETKNDLGQSQETLGDEIVTPIVIEDIPEVSIPAFNDSTQKQMEVPKIIDDTPSQEESQENFSDALDIKAIDDFLNQGGVNGMEYTETSPKLAL